MARPLIVDPTEPVPEVRFGILGAAAIAPNALVKPASVIPNVRVVSVAARDSMRAQRFADRFEIESVHNSYDALLEDPAINAVYIPLPNALHGTWTMRALQAGKHVLCEKPFAANAAEARWVRDAACASGLVVMEAFHWRYHPMNIAVLEAVATGAIGELTAVDGAFCFPLCKPADIRWSRDLAGGSLMDLGCYPLHMIRNVAAAASIGEPHVVDAKAAFTSGGIDRALHATLATPNGVPMTITCGLFNIAHPIALHLKITGTNGSISVGNPVLPHLGGRVLTRIGSKRRLTWAPRTTSYFHQLVAFRDAIVDGQPFPTNASDAVATMSLIDDIHRAAGVTPPVSSRQ